MQLKFAKLFRFLLSQVLSKASLLEDLDAYKRQLTLESHAADIAHHQTTVLADDLINLLHSLHENEQPDATQHKRNHLSKDRERALAHVRQFRPELIPFWLPALRPPQAPQIRMVQHAQKRTDSMP